MKILTLLTIIVALTGCSAAGHYGQTSSTKGLKTNCAGGCLVYKSDGTGCAEFQDATAQSCAAYFEKICTASPASCKN